MKIPQIDVFCSSKTSAKTLLKVFLLSTVLKPSSPIDDWNFNLELKCFYSQFKFLFHGICEILSLQGHFTYCRLPLFPRVRFFIDFYCLFNEVHLFCVLFKLIHKLFHFINELDIPIKDFYFFINCVMIAQFFQSTMLFNFLEKLKELINIGDIFAYQRVLFRVSKEGGHDFFVHLLL